MAEPKRQFLGCCSTLGVFDLATGMGKLISYSDGEFPLLAYGEDCGHKRTALNFHRNYVRESEYKYWGVCKKCGKASWFEEDEEIKSRDNEMEQAV